jgi:hypothetical protein
MVSSDGDELQCGVTGLAIVPLLPELLEILPNNRKVKYVISVVASPRRFRTGTIQGMLFHAVVTDLLDSYR